MGIGGGKGEGAEGRWRGASREGGERAGGQCGRGGVWKRGGVGDCSGPAGGGSDGSSVVGTARALLTGTGGMARALAALLTGTGGTARDFAQAAVDSSSSLSLVSRLM